MRKGLLAVLSVAFGCLLLMVFGIHVLSQSLQRYDPLSPETGRTQRFPLVVEGTPMAALQLMRYVGPFWEDGTGGTVAEVAALLVENTGGEFVAQGAVVLQWERMTLVFEVYLLPPGGKALVLEKDRQSMPEAAPTQCYGWSRGEYPDHMQQITVEEAGGVTMAVENRSGELIRLVQISYKTQNRESGIFLGGIAYTVELGNLRPGERRLVTPFRYVCGNSQVVRIQVYYE